MTNFEIDYAEKAHDIHVEARRAAKIINLGELYGGDMRPFEKPEFQPPQDLLQKARAFLEVNERWSILRQDWAEAKHAFKKECNRVNFPLGPCTQPDYVKRAAVRIVASDGLFHLEVEHCGF